MTTGFLYQFQEDDPRSPGWWRFSRPRYFQGRLLPNGNPPISSETIRHCFCTEDEAILEQQRWDMANPKG
jgi:hypothetical protein